MKRRFSLLLLAGALCLGLTACTPTGPEPTATPSPSPVPTATPEPTVPPLPEWGADLPKQDYAPWQVGYMEYLAELCEGENELRLWAANATSAEIDAEPERWQAYNDASNLYQLYNVDKDDVPELFIQYGNSEASYHTVCYTFREGKVEEIGEFDSGHSSLYSLPGENGVIVYWAHMGAAFAVQYALSAEGQLIKQEELYSSDHNSAELESYPEPEEIFAGSDLIPTYYTRTCTQQPEGETLLLPICDYWLEGPRQAESLLGETEIRETVGKVLWDGAEFTSVSGDNFYGAAGLTTLEAYLQPGGAYPYGDMPLSAVAYAWADANGDGQSDCILRLKRQENSWDEDFLLILSVQEGQVYGYFFDFLDMAVVDPDGSVYFQSWGPWRQVHFYKGQCYAAPSAGDPVVGDELAWDPLGG